VPLLAGNPMVDGVIPADAAVPRLLAERFDAAYGLDPDADGGALLALAKAHAYFGYRLDERGVVRPVNDAAYAWWQIGLDDHRKRANRRTYQSFAYEICELDGPVHPPQFSVPDRARRAIAERLALAAPAERFVLLNTGAGTRWAQKRWRPDHDIALIDLFLRREPGTSVILTGGPDEATLKSTLLEPFHDDPRVIDGGCGNTIDEFAALIERADLVVTPDSLAFHLATALHRPVVVIVGPTSPWELELYGRGEAISADVSCLACYRRACDKPVTCMDLLRPEHVYSACERVGQARRQPCSGAYLTREITRIEA
jgi:ADP-heptose:LPS heptosyltransferase